MLTCHQLISHIILQAWKPFSRDLFILGYICDTQHAGFWGPFTMASFRIPICQTRATSWGKNSSRTSIIITANMPEWMEIQITNIINMHITDLVNMYYKDLPKLNTIYFVGVDQAVRLLGRWSNLLGEDVFPFAARHFLNSTAIKH